MNRSSPVTRSGQGRQARLMGARLLAVFAMLLGTIAVGLQPTSAQSGGDSFTYDEDGLEWSVSWDDAIWAESNADAADFGLEGEAGSIVQFLTLPDYNQDPDECLAEVVPNFEDGAEATSAGAFEGEDGDPVADDTADYAYELRTVTLDIDGTDLDADVIHACYALDGSSLLWAVGLIPVDTDELDAAFELFDAIEVAGEPVELSLADAVSGAGGSGSDDDETPEASDEDEPTEEAIDEDEPTEEASNDSDATEEPSDDSDATEEASDDTDPTEEPSDEDDEETPEASDEDDGDADSGGSGGADEDAGTYESPTFGYTLEWDAGDWTVEDDLDVDAYQLSRDYLHIQDLDGSSILYVEGSDDTWSDTDECVETLLEEVEVDPADAELLDGEDGDPFEISENDRSAVAYQIAPRDNSDTDQDEIVMIDCRADPDGEVIVGFTNRSGFVDDYFGDGYPAVEEILDRLTFEGGGSGRNDDETPEASDDEDEPTAEASDEEEPTEEPSDEDEPTAEASDEDEETPEASDEDEPTAEPSVTGGVTGNFYVSPTYSYFLTWDEDVWTLEDESSEDEVDALVLSSDLLIFNLTGYSTGDGDPQTCLDNYLTVLSDRGDGNAEFLLGDDGAPIGSDTDSSESALRFIVYSVNGEQSASEVICATLGDEAVLGIEFAVAPGVTPDLLVSDEASAQISGILDQLAYFPV